MTAKYIANEGCRYSVAIDEQEALDPAEPIIQINIDQDRHPIQPRLRTMLVKCLKGSFVLLSVPWFISVIFFSVYDTKCIILEQSSVLNCSQSFFMSNPRHWISSWLIMSIFSSVLLMILIKLNCKELGYNTNNATKIFQKGSFWSLIFLLGVTVIFYVTRIIFAASNTTNLCISILLLLWLPVTAALVCCLNYVPQVTWTTADGNLPRFTLAWWKDSLSQNSNFILYWLALVVYFVEVTIKFAAILLDVAHEVAPLIQNRFPEETGQYRGVMVVVIGFRLAFHARLLSFFWQKLFHGWRDLFSEPSSKLNNEDEREAQREDE